jgi:hypothetical protein
MQMMAEENRGYGHEDPRWTLAISACNTLCPIDEHAGNRGKGHRDVPIVQSSVWAREQTVGENLTRPPITP